MYKSVSKLFRIFFILNIKIKFFFYFSYYYLITTKVKNIFYYLYKRNTFTYQTQINKRLNFNLRGIEKRLKKISKAIDPTNIYSVKEKYYGVFYIEKN